MHTKTITYLRALVFTSILAAPTLATAQTAASIKIMAVGDSITQGVRGADSYRPEFADLLSLTGCNYNMVGSQGTNANRHEGYSGHSAEHMIRGLGANPGIDAMMAAHSPDVVLLHIGSNDIRRSQSVSGTVAEVDEILTRIKAANANSTILVANVIPWFGAASNNNVTADVESLGDAIERLISNRADPGIVLVDVRNGFTPPMMQTDLVHPNSAGESFIADAFFNSYGSFYSCARAPDITAPRTFITSPSNNQNVNGTTTYAGHATDTGRSGFNRVRVAVRDTDTQLWYSFSDGTFGPISNNGITNAALDNTTANYTNWSIDLSLPTGNYQFFALAEDENGNEAFSGLGLSVWPVSTVFSVLNSSTPTTPTIPTTPASPVAQFTTRLQSPRTGLCISVPSGSTAAGANVDSSACINNAANQTLSFLPVDGQNNTFTIEFEHSGLCLTVPANSSANGASLTQNNCNGSTAQQFTLTDDGSNIALFTNTGNGNQVIDSHARTNDIIQWRDFGKNNQRWIRINSQTMSANPPGSTPVTQPVTPATPTTPASPVAQFITRLQSPRTGLCISVPSGSTAAGANVDSSACINNAANQTLSFLPVDGQNNTFTIEFEHSGLCLTVPANSTANGASLTQNNCNSSTAQQFTLTNDGSNIALFTNTGNGNQVIDSHGRTNDIIQWRDFGKNNQRWIRIKNPRS